MTIGKQVTFWMALIFAAYAVPARANDLRETVRATLFPSYLIQAKLVGLSLNSGSPQWDAAFDASLDGVMKILPKTCTGEAFKLTLCDIGVERSGSSSMQPSIAEGEIFLGLPYGRPADVQRGDVIVFNFQAGDTAPLKYAKRVIGLPGETVELKNGIVHVNGRAFGLTAAGKNMNFANGVFEIFDETTPEGRTYRIARGTDTFAGLDNAGPYTVPDGAFFVLGDNRHNSVDSRFFHTQNGDTYVDFKSIRHRAAVIYISIEADRNGSLVGPR